MESFIELIKRRRSIRKFTEELLSPSQAEAIFKAALMSPSSKSHNPWEFIVVEDKQKLQRLSECKEQSASFIANAALAVVVVADTLQSDVWVEDASIASIFLQLQAEDLGLGSCWVQVRNRITVSGILSEDYIREMFALPETYGVLSVIAIGHKLTERKPLDEEKLQWEKIHIDKW